MNYHWNWLIFWDMSPEGSGTYLQTLLYGLGWTVATSLTAWCMALAIGFAVGTARTLPNRKIALVANAYVELFRNIPLLVQMFLWYFVFPEFLPKAAGDWLKSLSNASFITAVLALAFYTSSRVAVQVTAGIHALPRGQRMAGLALGFTLPQTYRYVLLPMATRIVIPPLTNEFINIIKNSAVALTIGLLELTARTRSMQEFSFQVFEAFTMATLLYLVLNTCIVCGMRMLERRVRVPGMVGSSGAAGGK